MALKVETVVFLSLVLDLFAFTIPLPLFPRLIEWYTVRESQDPSGLLSRTLAVVEYLRGLVYSQSVHSKRWDVVLLGGLMGSAFSALQFLVSPHIGALSDRYGRRRVLLISMIGNILSALVWIQSTSFASYFLSRVIGGLSEGNVQLAIAILSDVTTPANRSKALAHVGIAFAICFIIGPPIGAFFSSRPVPAYLQTLSGVQLNVYALPALITLVLLTVETAFLYFILPETKGNKQNINNANSSEKIGQINGHSKPASSKSSPETRVALLKTLRHLHFLFLCLFSGMEFTLTFLTFDLLDWSNRQNGYLLGSIGIMSALLQGGYTRRATSKVGEGLMAQRGVFSCSLSLVLLAIFPQCVGRFPALATGLLRAAAVCLAFTSATVVTSLTSFSSLQCDEGFDDATAKPLHTHPELAKGKALGKFRSSGQLGRALGPLLACASYWTVGPSITYATSAAAMAVLFVSMRGLASTKSS